MNKYRITIQSPEGMEIWRDCNLDEMDSENQSALLADMLETLTQIK